MIEDLSKDRCDFKSHADLESDSTARLFINSLGCTAQLQKKGADYNLIVILDTYFGPTSFLLKREEHEPKKNPDLIRNLTQIVGFTVPLIEKHNQWHEDDFVHIQNTNDVLVELERHGVDPCVRRDLNKVRFPVVDVLPLRRKLEAHKADKISPVFFSHVDGSDSRNYFTNPAKSLSNH
jgi:hypothetical protein